MNNNKYNNNNTLMLAILIIWKPTFDYLSFNFLQEVSYNHQDFVLA